jgi:predicted branched-subunit amino acid permease
MAAVATTAEAPPAAPSRSAAISRAGSETSEMAFAVQGMRAMLPLLAALVPFGMAAGAAVAESDVDAVAGWSTSWLLYGGTSQLMAVRLLDEGASAAVVIATVLMLNARLLFYSAGLAPYWARAGGGFKALASYLIVDPSYVVAMDHHEREPDPRAQRWFYLGAAGLLWVGWLVANTAGLALGSSAAALFPLEVITPLIILGMVVPKLRHRPAITAGVVAAAVAVPGTLVPMDGGILLAGLVGIAAGMAASRRTS